MLSTNLLDMMKDPYSEDRQLAAPKEIIDLVERFENNKEAYKSGHYNETQVRREFVDPFFKALGWDVDNEQGFAEAYKDVIHEDAIKVGGTTRAPDYSFRVGGQRKFFLETKKPSVAIKDDIHPAFQLRRYAWTAKLPLSVLTDFEELSVYDCSVKPDQTDKPSKGRIFYLTYQDYLTKWDEVASIFSKDAILKGSFDRFAADKKGKRGTAEVDAAFLEEIAGWREILARNIALRNPDISTQDLNYSVQAIVNRLVFLRICEDRGIERLMKLQDLLNGERVYPRLCEFFRQADERYNSGIFHFEKEPGRESPDTLTLSLQIDDKPLKDIIKRLYYPDSPYEFSVLPAEILGQVYEQFLGKVIRLTEGHRAVVEDKPEVKKAGGVKYTPVYIVEAIVKKTLGPTLEGKTPLVVVLITVLDPACGSGSFLIVAYQYLLDWHREWYLKNLVPLLESGMKPSSPEVRRMLPGANNEPGKKGRKKEPELPVFQGRGGEWRLTTAERKRILLNNIYGVDIDRQAVEVTKLSLLLKVLEGENDETISKQLTLFQERALPDLSNNIKCGNSLIGWDILRDNPSLTREEIDRVNPFDWEKEFPEVFQRGGFNIIIGNPPYHSVKLMDEISKKYFYKKYSVGTKRFNLFSIFIEASLSILRQKDKLGFIIPSSFLANSQYLELRNLILNNFIIKEIINFGGGVFAGANVETLILILCQESDHETRQTNQVSITDKMNGSLEKNQTRLMKIQKEFGNSCNCVFELMDEIPINRPTESLKNLCVIKNGINTGNIADRIITNIYKGDCCKPLIDGKDVHRYEEPTWRRNYVIYDVDYVEKLREETRINGKLWTARIIKKDNYFEREKLVLQRIRNLSLKRRLVLTYDQNKYYTSINIGVILNNSNPRYNLKYLLGILNSNLINKYYAKRYHNIQIKNEFLGELPIPIIDFSDPADAARHDLMVSLVDSMLSLHKQIPEARTPHEQTAFQRQIEATDGQIDALVYELYGLTEEEIKIVEGTCRQI